MNAIVVDDDRSTVDVIVEKVHWSKFHIDRVLRAYNIQEAEQIFQSTDIDLAVCDIEMPMGSGLDLLKWVRDRNLETQFIFLTNHERFDFAQTAIQYRASGYVVKPFQAERMEAELAAAVRKIRHEEQYKVGQKYEKWFSGNLSYVEASFWSDLILGYIPSKPEVAEAEIQHRRIPVRSDAQYRPVLVSTSLSDADPALWGKDGEGTFEYAVGKLSAEMLTGRTETGRVVSIRRKDILLITVILDAEDTAALSSAVSTASAEPGRGSSGYAGPQGDSALRDQAPDGRRSGSDYAVSQGDSALHNKAQKLIDFAHNYLGCTLTVYLGKPGAVTEAAQTVRHLEELDRNNVASKGHCFEEDDEIVLHMADGHILNQERIKELLAGGRTRELLNLLKFSMESLAAEKKLDAAALSKIRQELLQIVYVYLYSCQIQATRLFANEAAETLERRATDSVMDMMRWQIYLITQTIDSVTQIRQSDSVVNRAKAFIHDHYRENISWTEIAASMYLAPEYMAKLFKKETGISLKQYLSDYRIRVAKELLARRDVRISDVAQEVGFDNFSYFSTVFRKAAGMTPNEYHNQASAGNITE